MKGWLTPLLHCIRGLRKRTWYGVGLFLGFRMTMLVFIPWRLMCNILPKYYINLLRTPSCESLSLVTVGLLSSSLIAIR